MSANESSGVPKQIVVGISDAPTSQIAARHAVELAAATGASVHFVTAVDRLEREIVQWASDEFVLDNVLEARHSVENFVNKLGVGVPYTIAVAQGAPADLLVAEAERVGADLIVVGNVRMQGIGRVLGSVGSEVLRQAPCSVLIVKTV
ncbi:MAG: universal stress protein [Acidimicrobiales bacterium]